MVATVSFWYRFWGSRNNSSFYIFFPVELELFAQFWCVVGGQWALWLVQVLHSVLWVMGT